MNKLIAFLFFGLFGLSVQAQQLSNGIDSLSYALGKDIARSVKSMGIDVNAELVSKALLEALQGKESLFTESQAQQVIRQKLMEAQEAKNAIAKQVSAEFMENNKKNKGVVVDSSGLQYIVLQEGSGDKPTSDATVKVHYAGRLTDGSTFDSSYDRGEPISLSLDRVIKGWQIGLPMMSVGSKYRFFIPHELGYGERGSGKIPPFSSLIFDIELLDIEEGQSIEVQ